MATRLLHVVCTPRGLASNTGRVSNVLLEDLRSATTIFVTTLDLFKADLPAVAGRNIKSKYMLMTGQALDDVAKASWRQIERTNEQFLDHDMYVLTVPMWNFGIRTRSSTTSTPSSSRVTCSSTRRKAPWNPWSTDGR